jgi:copper chaperone
MESIHHNGNHPATSTVKGTGAVVRQRHDVRGMSCSHCEHAVSTAIAQIPGVVTVAADATAGTVTVECTRELDRAEVAAAVDEAGYELG